MRKGLMALLLAHLASVASADTLLTYGEDGQVADTRIYIAGGKVRADTGDGFALVDTRQRTVTVVDHTEKTYMLQTEQELQAMAQQMGALGQQMQGMLANLPPEQRAAMANMGLKLPSATTSEAVRGELRETSRHETIQGMRCRVYLYDLGSGGQAEACIARRDDTLMPEEDVDALRSLSIMVEPLASAASAFSAGSVPAALPAAIDGVPLRFVTAAEGSHRVSTLQSIEHDALDASLFELPEGYTRRSMPSMPVGLP